MKTTTHYHMFALSEKNRPVVLTDKNTKNLIASMERHGWLSSFPMTVRKSLDGKLEVVDGQHRLHIAMKLGLPAKYVEENRDIDVAALQTTQKAWKLEDYVSKYAKEGVADYAELLQYSAASGIGVSLSSAFLGGTVSHGNIRQALLRGQWRIKDRETAHRLQNILTALAEINPKFRHKNCITAVYRLLFVAQFDSNRLLAGARRQAGSVLSVSTIDAWSQALERLYNYGRKEHVPLAFLADEAARARNFAAR